MIKTYRYGQIEYNQIFARTESKTDVSAIVKEIVVVPLPTKTLSLPISSMPAVQPTKPQTRRINKENE